jgi:predicted O-linked N-acetylglucosamine transferase (SPINDLY family)
MAFGLVQGIYASALQHHQAGRLPEAESGYRQALSVSPNHYESLHMLGVIAGQTGHHEDALALAEQAIAVRPDVAEAHANRAVALLMLARRDEAAAGFRKAIAMKPSYAPAHIGLANALREMGDLDDAIDTYRDALKLQPDDPEALTNMGIAYQQLEQYDAAVDAFEQAVMLAPSFPMIHHNLGIALHHQGRLDEAGSRFHQAIQIGAGYPQSHAAALLGLHYRHEMSPALIKAAHKEWERVQTANLTTVLPPLANDRDPERRLRIGYVSGDLQTHPVGYFMTKVLAGHDPRRVETFCYATNGHVDAMTHRLKASANHWRDVSEGSPVSLAEQVREDRIDILVDLSGHTDRNRLLTFALRAAPVQASWLGYPGSTGLSAMDYLILDRASAPDSEDALASEAIVRLPNRFCYDPPAAAPAVVARPAGAPVVFGSFNNIAKVRPQVVALWAKVLKAVPGSRLVLKWKSYSQPSVRARLLREFKAEGIEADRIDLRLKSPHTELLAEYGDIDIALDTFPFSGGLTSCEALWMGVPVITLPRDRPVSRQTLGFLQAIGHAELSAANEDDYVRIAADLAADSDRRAALRTRLRPDMAASPLCDGPGFARTLEDAYRQMWRRWCAGEAPAPIAVA